MWPGFKSLRRRHMWVEFVFGSRTYSERFFSGISGFPLSSKTIVSKFDRESGRRRTNKLSNAIDLVILSVKEFYRKICLLLFHSEYFERKRIKVESAQL